MAAALFLFNTRLFRAILHVFRSPGQIELLLPTVSTTCARKGAKEEKNPSMSNFFRQLH